MSPSSETNKPPEQKQSRRTSNPFAHNPADDTFFVNSTSTGNKQRRLPQWLDHFNMKDLKVLFKTSLAVWITTLFIFINPTLEAIGQATFFAW